MKDLKLNTNSKIEIINNDKSYKSSILSIESDSMLISSPVHSNRQLTLCTGARLDLTSCSSNGKCFKFNCNVLAKEVLNSRVYYRVSAPYNIARLQRREFFRAEMLQEVEFKVITNKPSRQIPTLPYVTGLLLDLSGSGLKLKTEEELADREILSIKLELSNLKLELKGQVVRAVPNTSNNFIYGIKFIGVKDVITELIIKEVFEIDRKRTKTQ